MRVSTVKKSHARMPWAWERRNSVHVRAGSAWSGTQTMPSRTVRMVVPETRVPSFISSPRIRW